MTWSMDVLHPPRFRGDGDVDGFAQESCRLHNGECFACVHGSDGLSDALNVLELTLFRQKLEEVRFNG